MDIPFLPSHTLEPTRTLSRASSRSSNGGPRTSSRLSTQEEGRPDSRISNADANVHRFILHCLFYALLRAHFFRQPQSKMPSLCTIFIVKKYEDVCLWALYAQEMHKQTKKIMCKLKFFVNMYMYV